MPCASCFSLAIYEVGGVPFSVLEPVLERCTPEQLYRIEECNHVSALAWKKGWDVQGCPHLQEQKSKQSSFIARVDFC